MGTDQNLIFTGVPERPGRRPPGRGPADQVLAVPRALQPGRRGLHRVRVLPVRHRRDQGAGGQVGPLPRRAAGRRAGRRRPDAGRALGPRARTPGSIRMHFSGCSASCAQPQIADIGFRGDVAQVGNHLAEAVDIGMGGSLGSDAGFIDWVEHARPVNDVPDALLRVVRRYQSERRDGRAVPQLGPPRAERRAADHAGRRGDRHPGRTPASPRRGASMKAYRIREEMNGIEEPPGKTWFFELQAGVIDAGRCIQCGTCVAACPSNSIGIDEDTDLPELVKMCTGCSLCWDFCPRGGLRYEALWPPSTVLPGGRGRRGRRRPRSSGSTPPTPTGRSPAAPPATASARSLDAYAVRAGARPDGAQDGGVVIGAARSPPWPPARSTGPLVTRPSDDPERAVEGGGPPGHHGEGDHRGGGQLLQPDHGPGRARPLAATTCRPSRGSPWSARRARSRASGPCRPGGGRPGAHRIDAVVLTIALLCTKSFDYRGLMLELLREDRGIDIDRVSARWTSSGAG